MTTKIITGREAINALFDNKKLKDSDDIIYTLYIDNDFIQILADDNHTEACLDYIANNNFEVIED